MNRCADSVTFVPSFQMYHLSKPSFHCSEMTKERGFHLPSTSCDNFYSDDNEHELL